MKFKISFPLLLLLAWASLCGIKLLPLMISVLIHETGHVIALKYFGGTVGEIRATLKGIDFKMSGKGLFKRHEIILINLSGPLAGLLTAALAYLIGDEELGKVNLALSLFNLIPLEGLDGGEALKQLLNK